MPLLPRVRVPLEDYWRIAEAADAKNVSLAEQVEHIWRLGLAAAGVNRSQEVVSDRQLVAAGASNGT